MGKLKHKEIKRCRKKRDIEEGEQVEKSKEIKIESTGDGTSEIKSEKKEEEFVDIVLEDMEYEFEMPELDTELIEIKREERKITDFVDIELVDVDYDDESVTYELDTTLMEIKKKEIKYEFVDFELETMEDMDTEMEINAEDIDTTLIEIPRKKERYDFVDIELVEFNENEDEIYIESEIDTELDFRIEDVLMLSEGYKGGRKMVELILEKFINSNKKVFPRNFSETLNEPIVVLIGEKQKNWHIPILYILYNAMREIMENPPRVVFRSPERVDTESYVVSNEWVDSTDLASLENFNLNNSIEFFDLRTNPWDIEDVIFKIQNRLKAGFLQRFGVFAISVRREELLNAYDQLRDILKGSLKIYVIDPEGEKKIYGEKIENKILGELLSKEKIEKLYEILVQTITGVPNSSDIFKARREYEQKLDNTLKKYSVFVNRQVDEMQGQVDKYQYPYKVAVFYYLLNVLLLKNKIKAEKISVDKIWNLVKKHISVEKIFKVENKSVYPDIFYKDKKDEDKGIAIEIETLIGTMEPMKKVDETVGKYKDKDIREVNEVWIVLSPVAALLHYEEIKHREKAYKVMYDFEIKFKVLTLEKNKSGTLSWYLKDIGDFVNSKIKTMPDEMRKGGDSNE